MRVPPTRADLIDQLDRQVGYLVRSSAMFDAGYEDEAARLAVTLRVLLHDTAKSHSLLGQLDVKRSIEFDDTSTENRSRIEGETLIVSFEQPGLVVIISDPGPRYVAPLGARPVRAQVPFDAWWRPPIAAVHGFDEMLSRWDLIDAFAHQDGGAHVDRRGLDERYRALATAGYGFMFMNLPAGAFPLPATPPVDKLQFAAGNAASASVRQIAHEFLSTMAREKLPDRLR